MTVDAIKELLESECRWLLAYKSTRLGWLQERIGWILKIMTARLMSTIVLGIPNKMDTVPEAYPQAIRGGCSCV